MIGNLNMVINIKFNCNMSHQLIVAAAVQFPIIMINIRLFIFGILYFQTELTKGENINIGINVHEGDITDCNIMTIDSFENIPDSIFTAPKQKKLARKEDPKINIAFDILEKSTKRDDVEVYAEHVVMKLRKYDSHIFSVIQHLINNILFDTDIGKCKAHYTETIHQQFRLISIQTIIKL